MSWSHVFISPSTSGLNHVQGKTHLNLQWTHRDFFFLSLFPRQYNVGCIRYYKSYQVVRHGFYIQESTCRCSESVVLQKGFVYGGILLSKEGPNPDSLWVPMGHWIYHLHETKMLCFSNNFIVVNKLRIMFIHPRTQPPSWFPGDVEQICPIKKLIEAVYLSA